MNRLFTIITSLVLCTTALFAQKENQATWMNNPISTDGKPTEWKKPLRYFNDISNIAYTIANDSTHLYMCFSIPVHIVQIKMIRNGFEVRIDTLGKKRGQTSIIFPVGNNERTDFERLRTRTTSDQKDSKDEKSSLKLRYLMQPQIMSVSGMKHTQGTINQKEPHPIKGRIDWDDEYTMIYELSIPFQEILGRNITEKDTRKNWVMTISTKGFKFDNSKDPAQYNFSSFLINEQRFHQKFFLSLP